MSSTNQSSIHISVSYICTLKRHIKSVNAIQFHPKGESFHFVKRCNSKCDGLRSLDATLASGGDGGMIVLWKHQVTSCSQPSATFALGEPADENMSELEQWIPSAIYRASDMEDIYDIKWSPNGQYLIVGLTDNSASVWDMTQGRLAA